MVTTLLLARHGETDWNRDHRWQGHTGPPLNETGRRQAAELAAQIRSVDAVYSSDTERAYETAVILAERHGLHVETDARLREVNFGFWEGLTRAEINERFGGGFSLWLSGASSTPDGGNPTKPWRSVFSRRFTTLPTSTPTGGFLVVTSGGPIRAVEAHLRRIDQATARRVVQTVPNCSLVELVIRDGTLSAVERA